jgi:hypothetical protein
MRGHTQEEHPSDRMNWKHGLEETGQSPEPTPPALVLSPEPTRAVSGQQEQGYQPRIGYPATLKTMSTATMPRYWGSPLKNAVRSKRPVTSVTPSARKDTMAKTL